MAVSVRCDGCGVELVTNAKRLAVFGWRNGYKTSGELLDLCVECQLALKAFLASRLAEAGVPEAQAGAGARALQRDPPDEDEDEGVF